MTEILALSAYDSQDRILTYGAAAYTFNVNGYLSRKTEGTAKADYVYNAFGALLSVTSKSSTSATPNVIEYINDGFGRRIVKKVNGAITRRFIYDTKNRLIAELDGAGNITTRLVYGIKYHSPDYLLKNGVNYKVISDHLGSIRMVVNSTTGVIAQQLDYDELGNVLTDTSPGFQPLGFAGGIYDADTGQVRFGARDYDPVTGRWTAKDPILFAGRQANVYGYVSNDPINFVDSNGQKIDIIGGGGAGGVGIGIGFGSGIGGIAILPATKVPDMPTTGSGVAPEGYEWKGQPGSVPGSRDGNYYNPKTKDSLRPDLEHPDPIGPHWDWKSGETGEWWRLYPDGRKEPKCKR